MIGVLCASSSELPGTPGALERLCTFAGQVAERLRSEIGETEGTTMFLPPPVQVRKEAKEDLERRVNRVAFKSPPTSVRAAARRYRWAALTRPGLWIKAILIDGVILVLPTAFLTAFVEGAIRMEHVAPVALVVVAVFSALFAVFFPFSVRSMVRYEATATGYEAFVRGYARTRNLMPVDPSQNQIEQLRLRLPGGVFTVLSGILPSGAGEGLLLAFRRQQGRRDWRHGALAAVTRLEISTAPPAMSLSPRGSLEGFIAMGGFVLEAVTGLERFDARPDIGLDPRLREHYDVVVDGQASSGEAQAILTPELVSWLLAQEESRGLGFALEGRDVVVFTTETKLIQWSEADLDAVCASLARVRAAVVRAYGSNRPAV
jgi:hypothetical protein